MQFFKPSDIRTVECVINNITRGGFAFANTEDGESVFIMVRLVEVHNLEVGDTITCYCVDQSLDENRRPDPMSARYRAIRVVVGQRLSDMMIPNKDASTPIKAVAPVPAPEPEPEPYVAPLPLMTSVVLKEVAFNVMRAAEGRAWSSRDLADHISFHNKGIFDLPDDVPQKVSAMLHAEHHAGRVAACSIRKERDQKQPSGLYYALTTDTLIDLMENYEMADE